MTIDEHLESELIKFRSKFQDRVLTQDLKEEIAEEISNILKSSMEIFGNESPVEMWFQIKQNGDFLVFYEGGEETLH